MKALVVTSLVSVRDEADAARARAGAKARAAPRKKREIADFVAAMGFAAAQLPPPATREKAKAKDSEPGKTAKAVAAPPARTAIREQPRDDVRRSPESPAAAFAPQPPPSTDATQPHVEIAPHAPEFRPLLAAAAEDPSMTAVLLPRAAHLTVDADAGGVAVHVRVLEGVAHVRVGGDAAHLFADQAPDLGAALAGQGLSLGRFDLDERTRRRDEPAPEPEPELGPPPRPALVATPEDQRKSCLVHVKA